MNIYDYELVNGHIIVVDEEHRYLIDTGAPASISSISPFLFAGLSTPVVDQYLGITLDSLSKNVGSSLNAMIGVDILNQFDVLIDPSSNSIRFSTDPLALEVNPVAIENFLGIPIIVASLGEEQVKLFLDTGAKISYLSTGITDALQPSGTVEDFYPDYGSFSTSTFQLNLKVGNEVFDLCFGNLPEILEMTLLSANVQGILGTEVLVTHKMLYSPRKSQICFQRL